MPVEFRCATARGRIFARDLLTDAENLLRAAGVPECELSLLLVSDRAMRALNRKYRHLDRPTDVLSFSQLEELDAPTLDLRTLCNHPGMPLGDVVISIDTAIRQARELKIEARSRLRTLLVHGFLHLLGYDHERSTAEARRMFARARALESKIALSRKTFSTAKKSHTQKPSRGHAASR